MSDRVLDRVLHVLLLLRVAVPVGMLSWFAGLVGAMMLRSSITGSPFLDSVILALAPWGLGFAAYAAIRRARGRRFGPRLARPPWSAKDGALVLGAATGGALLIALTVTAARRGEQDNALLLGFMGAGFVAFAASSVARALREPGER